MAFFFISFFRLTAKNTKRNEDTPHIFKIEKNKFVGIVKNQYLCPAFRAIAVMKSYLICCTGNDKQFNNYKNNGFY